MLLVILLVLCGASVLYLQSTIKAGANYRATKSRWHNAEQSQALYWAARAIAPSVIDHAELQERILTVTNATPAEASAAIEALRNRTK